MRRGSVAQAMFWSRICRDRAPGARSQGVADCRRQLALVGGQQAARRVAAVKVGAEDISGILSGLVTYTDGGGEWHSADLAYAPALAKWVAEIPAALSTRYFVQMVDGAGNVTVADNKGRYYAVAFAGVKRYLPAMARGN